MPGGDRTGPRGAGPMTGRAAGYCAGSPTPGYATPGFGRAYGGGRGRGVGGGRGWRNTYYATGVPGWARFGANFDPEAYPLPQPEPDPELQRQALRHQADALQHQLDLVNKRLADFEASAE